MSSPLSEAESDKHKQVAQKAKPNILVIGCGGSGCNTINHMADEKLEFVERIAINTDAQDLLHTNANQKIVIGKEITGGLGTGSSLEKGKKSAYEDEEKIKDAIDGYELVFVTCGLGGGTGSGAGPVVSEISRDMGALTVGIVTLPFESEGEKRTRNAYKGLKEFKQKSDTTVIVPDDKLLEVVPDLSLEGAFKLADSVLVDTISGISKLVSETGLINLDFEDVRTTFKNGGVGVVGFGEGSGNHKSKEAVTEALQNPLLDMKVENAEKALISITGSPNMKLDEAKAIAENISEKLSPDARIAWGARLSDELEDKIMTMLIISGTKKLEEDAPVDLDIDYL